MKIEGSNEGQNILNMTLKAENLFALDAPRVTSCNFSDF